MTRAELREAKALVHRAESSGLSFVHPMEIIAALASVAKKLIEIVEGSGLYSNGEGVAREPYTKIVMNGSIPDLADFPEVKPFNPHQLDGRQIEDMSEHSSLIEVTHAENLGLLRVYEKIESEGRRLLWRRRIEELCVHTNPDGEKYFQCLNCLSKSYHPQDVAQLYCGKCHRFWGDDIPDGFLQEILSKL